MTDQWSYNWIKFQYPINMTDYEIINSNFKTIFNY